MEFLTTSGAVEKFLDEWVLALLARMNVQDTNMGDVMCASDCRGQ